MIIFSCPFVAGWRTHILVVRITLLCQCLYYQNGIFFEIVAFVCRYWSARLVPEPDGSGEKIMDLFAATYGEMRVLRYQHRTQKVLFNENVDRRFGRNFLAE